MKYYFAQKCKVNMGVAEGKEPFRKNDFKCFDHWVFARKRAIMLG